MADGIQALKGIDPQALAAFVQSLTETQKGYATTGGNMGPTLYDAGKARRQRDDLVQKYLGDVEQTRAMTNAMNQIIEEHAQKNARLGRAVSREKDVGVTSRELSDEQDTPTIPDEANLAAVLANSLKGPLANEKTAVDTIKAQSEGGGDTLNGKTPGDLAFEGINLPINMDPNKRPDVKNAKTAADAVTESARVQAAATENAGKEHKSGNTRTTTRFELNPKTNMVETVNEQTTDQNTESSSTSNTSTLEGNVTVRKLVADAAKMKELATLLKGGFTLSIEGGQVIATSTKDPNMRKIVRDDGQQTDDRGRPED